MSRQHRPTTEQRVHVPVLSAPKAWVHIGFINQDTWVPHGFVTVAKSFPLHVPVFLSVCEWGNGTARLPRGFVHQ